ETMALMADVDMPLVAMRLQIASGVNVILQVARFPDGSRKVTHITEVLGYDIQSMKYDLQDLFVREFREKDAEGRIITDLVPTGTLPRCLSQIREHGADLPASVYRCAEAKANGAQHA